MQKKTKKVIVLIILAIALAASAFLKIYILADSSGATVYWKGDEAYLFLGVGHDGYRLSYLEYPFVVIGEHFYVVPSPLNRCASSLVIHITPAAVERHSMGCEEVWSGPLNMTPFDDGFYAMCPGVILCKMTVNGGFRPATEEEQRRIGSPDRLVHFLQDTINGMVNGWHVRSSRRSPGDHFEAEIGKNLVISVRNHATDVRAYPSVSVELLRPGQAPEGLYNVNGTPRRVSKSEYDRAFNKH